MASLGDKIRDAIIEKLGKKGELKAVVMERAAKILGMSKSSLYQKLNAENIDVNLLEEIRRELGINTEILKNSIAESSDQSAEGLELFRFKIKNKEARVYLPKDIDKEGFKTLISYLNILERNTQ